MGLPTKMGQDAKMYRISLKVKKMHEFSASSQTTPYIQVATTAQLQLNLPYQILKGMEEKKEHYHKWYP